MASITILEAGAAGGGAGAANTLGLASLRGAVVGFIDNTKPNFNCLVDELARVLVQDHGVREVLKRGKRVQSIPAPDPVLDELAAHCDLVITGSGD